MHVTALALALAIAPTAQAGVLIGDSGAPGIGDPAAYVDEWGRMFLVDGDDGDLVSQVDAWGRATTLHLGPEGLLIPRVAPLVIETEAGTFLTVDPKSGALIPVDWTGITTDPKAGTDVGNPATDPKAGTDVGNPATDDPTLFPVISPYDYQNGDDMLLIPLPNPLVEPSAVVVASPVDGEVVLWPVSTTLSTDEPGVDAKAFAGIAADLIASGGLLWGILDIELDAGRMQDGVMGLELGGADWYVNEYGLMFEVDAETGELIWSDEYGTIRAYVVDTDGSVILYNDLGDKLFIEAPDVVGSGGSVWNF